eukprot:Skav212620  [mRNA]  locus=scaffold173:64886:65784:- [translate_table: standard]
MANVKAHQYQQQTANHVLGAVLYQSLDNASECKLAGTPPSVDGLPDKEKVLESLNSCEELEVFLCKCLFVLHQLVTVHCYAGKGVDFRGGHKNGQSRFKQLNHRSHECLCGRSLARRGPCSAQRGHSQVG